MIIKRLMSALLGRRKWLEIKKKYGVDDGVYVLLMPESDRELNEQALIHIDDLVKYRHALGVVILTDNIWVQENARTYSKNIIDIDELLLKEIDSLISFCELYMFSERLLVVSLTKPYGSNLFRAVGVNGITKEDLVCLSIFLIRSWSCGESGYG